MCLIKHVSSRSRSSSNKRLAKKLLLDEEAGDEDDGGCAVDTAKPRYFLPLLKALMRLVDAAVFCMHELLLFPAATPSML